MKVGNGAHRRNHTAGRNRKAKRKKGGKTGRRGRDEERQVNRVEVGEQRGENRENTDIYIYIYTDRDREEGKRERESHLPRRHRLYRRSTSCLFISRFLRE